MTDHRLETSPAALPEPTRPVAATFTRRATLAGSLGLAAATVIASAAELAHAAPSEKFPWIIDCDGWGARPPTDPLSVSPIATNKIVIHHMAFPNVTDYSREQAIKLAVRCQNLHIDGNKWSDTGQHFTVSRGGYVLEGRRGSLAQLDTGGNQIISAHCPGENTRGIGIESEGTYITEEPTEELLVSLVKLCVAIAEQYRLNAWDIFGHWDFRATQCPGIAFYKLFPGLRRQIARKLGDYSMSEPRRWPDPYRSTGGPGVATAKYLLVARGYPLTINGTFDEATVMAVQDWQARNGLPVEADATITPATWESLIIRLTLGDSGPAVSAVQAMLEIKGYGTKITGAYDSATATAVRQLQRLHRLPPVGEVGPSTWCALVGGTVRETFR